jgi:hypothetical protein
MNRTLSNLFPGLSLAAATLVASVLVVAAPHAAWAAVVGPLLLVLALVGVDVVQRRRSGRGSLPSASVLLMAAGIVLASVIVAGGDLHQLAEMIPVFGACAVIPFIQRRQGARNSCRPA